MATSGMIVASSVTDCLRYPIGSKVYGGEDLHEDEMIDTSNARLEEKPRPDIDVEANWVKKCRK